MKKLICIALALLMIMGIFCACDDKKKNDNDDEDIEIEEETEKKSKWQIGEHEVKIDSAWRSVSGGTLYVKYIFTNGSNQSCSFLSAGLPAAYQGGIELDTPMGYGFDFTKKVKAGASAEFIGVYSLDSKEDIEVEVTGGSYSKPVVVTRTFKYSSLEVSSEK